MFSSFYIKSYNKKSIKDTSTTPSSITNDHDQQQQQQQHANGKLMNGNGVAKTNGTSNGYCAACNTNNNNNNNISSDLKQNTAEKKEN